MYWAPDYGPMNIWCEFEKDQLKTLLCRMYTIDPLVATNVTNW